MLTPGNFRYFNYNQKVFEIGDPGTGTLGVVTWGLGGLGELSYRTLLALLADDLKKQTAKSVILVFIEQLGRLSSAGLFLVIEIAELLPAVVLHDEGGADVLDGPRRWEGGEPSTELKIAGAELRPARTLVERVNDAWTYDLRLAERLLRRRMALGMTIIRIMMLQRMKYRNCGGGDCKNTANQRLRQH